VGVLLLEMSLTVAVAGPGEIAAALMGSLVLSCAEVGREKNQIQSLFFQMCPM